MKYNIRAFLMIFGKCEKMWKICFEIKDNAFPLISDCGICYELNLSADEYFERMKKNFDVVNDAVGGLCIINQFDENTIVEKFKKEFYEELVILKLK